MVRAARHRGADRCDAQPRCPMVGRCELPRGLDLLAPVGRLVSGLPRLAPQYRTACVVSHDERRGLGRLVVDKRICTRLCDTTHSMDGDRTVRADCVSGHAWNRDGRACECGCVCRTLPGCRVAALGSLP